MSALGWVMTSLAIWHFAVFVPDRFWGGIIGAAFGAVLGGVLTGWLLSGLTVPGPDDTNLLTVAYAVPGTVIGLVVTYLAGARAAIELEREARQAATGR